MFLVEGKLRTFAEVSTVSRGKPLGFAQRRLFLENVMAKAFGFEVRIQISVNTRMKRIFSVVTFQSGILVQRKKKCLTVMPANHCC